MVAKEFDDGGQLRMVESIEIKDTVLLSAMELALAVGADKTARLKESTKDAVAIEINFLNMM